MTRKRQILNCFVKPYLYEIAKYYEISGAYRMNAGDLVDALSRKRSVKVEEILNELSLQDLKIICQGVGLDDKGRTKAFLIDRLLNRDKTVKLKPPKKSKTKLDTDKQGNKVTSIVADPDKKVSACRIIGSKIDRVLTPDGWNYDRSLSKHFKFVQAEEKYDRLVFLEHNTEWM
jgi:hypothetical protein